MRRGRVVARPGRRRRRGTGAGRARSRGARPSAGRRPRTTNPAAGRRPGRPTGRTAAGGAHRSRRRAGRPAACRAPRACTRPSRWTTSAPARRPGATRRGVGDGGVGRGDEHEVGVAAGVGDSTAGAPRRSAAARVDGASIRRPATATGVQPRAASATRASCRPGRDPRARATRRCDRLLRRHPAVVARSRLFVPAPVAGAGLLGRRQLLPGSGRTSSRSAGMRDRHAGSRSASGTSTNARSPIRGCGTTRSGSSTRSSPTGARRRRACAGPSARARTRAASASMRCGELEQLARREVGVDRDDRVQVVVLRGPPTGAVSYTGDTATTSTPSASRRARRPPAAGARAGRRGSSRARGTRVARPAERHRSMRTATWSTIARTGGCSLRTVTATAVTRSSTRHTSAMRVASRSSSW